MTAPSFVNTDYAYQQLNGITDVQSVMDAVLTMLTTTLSNSPTGVFPTTQRWGNPSGFIFDSPADVKGRTMKVTLTRASATRMTCNIADPGATLFTATMDIAGGGSQVNIFAGPGHFYVESNNAGTWETLRGFISDPTPEALDSAAMYVWCAAYRANSGVGVTNGPNPEYWGGRNLDGTLIGTVSLANYATRPLMYSQDTVNTKLATEAGTECAFPFCVSPINAANSVRLNAGKLYQAAVVSSSNAPGTILEIPIDTGLTGKFQVLNLAAAGTYRLAVRRP